MSKIKELFFDDYKDAFLIERQNVRDLREALKRVENKLAIQEQAAVSVLMLYGLEAVQAYKDVLATKPKQ